MSRARRLGVALVALVLAVSLASAAAAEPRAVVCTAPPTISGKAVFDRVLQADPGTWEPAEVTFA